MTTDVLIAGSGIAGLSLAVKLNNLNPGLRITIITKAAATEGNTRYAQGGIAAVMNKITDSYENHINDTIKCGKGLCDRKIVEMVVRQAPERIKELIRLGAHFDYEDAQHLALGLEGGHSANRIVHHKDQTGFEVESTLMQQLRNRKNIFVFDNITLIDLMVDDMGLQEKCTGAIIYHSAAKEIQQIRASVTVLASGGCGQVYKNTTNPIVATGDGYAIAARAGAAIKNMRFMQFHPTALYDEQAIGVKFLISEALRGYGAHIVDKSGKRFLFDYDRRGEMATRDIVSAAIYHQMKVQGVNHMYIDLRHLDRSDCESHFPQITAHLTEQGYDIGKDLIPVVPSAHYQCGGVEVNAFAQTSIPGLYAIGEVACTGLHGANRLASNSLLEALVFSSQAAAKIYETIPAADDITIIQKSTTSVYAPILTNKTIDALEKQIKELMSDNAFEPDTKHWKEAIFKLEGMMAVIAPHISDGNFSPQLLYVRNMAQTAQLILSDKLAFEPQQLQSIEQLEEFFI